jgi:hypothetical protein
MSANPWLKLLIANGRLRIALTVPNHVQWVGPEPADAIRPSLSMLEVRHTGHSAMQDGIWLRFNHDGDEVDKDYLVPLADVTPEGLLRIADSVFNMEEG